MVEVNKITANKLQYVDHEESKGFIKFNNFYTQNVDVGSWGSILYFFKLKPLLHSTLF